MTLEEINGKLDELNREIVFAYRAYDSKGISNVTKALDAFIRNDNGEVLEAKDEEGKSLIDKFVEHEKKVFEKFDYKGWIKEQAKKDNLKIGTDEYKEVVSRADKIVDLIKKIKDIGKINTIIEEVSNRYQENELEDFRKVRDGRDEDNAQNILTMYSALDNYISFSSGDLNNIEKYDKEENEYNDIMAQINDINDEISSIQNELNEIAKIPEKDRTTEENTHFDMYTEMLNEKNTKLAELNKSAIAKKDIIDKTDISVFKSNLENGIPDVLSTEVKESVRNAIASENPRDALNDIKDNLLNEYSKYNNRITKRQNNRSALKSAKDVRSTKPVKKSYDANDYTLSDDELEKVDLVADEFIKDPNYELTSLPGLTDEIKQIIEDHNKSRNLPASTDKKIKREAKKKEEEEIMEWLKDKDDIKGPLKGLRRRIQARSDKTKDAYNDEKLKKAIKEKIEDTIKRSRYDKDKAKMDDATETVDHQKKNFKEALRAKVLGMDDEAIKALMESREYGKMARNVYGKILDDEDSGFDLENK